jgi:mannosyltransferase
MPGSGPAPGQSGALTQAASAAPAGPATAAGDQPGRRRWPAPGWLAVAVSGLFGLAFGAYQVGVPTLWRDEAATIEAATRTVPQILALLHHVDAVTGAYYLFMHPVVTFLGTSATAVRLPSVLAMAVAAAFTTALGRRLAELAGLPAPALTGLLAGLIFTTVPQVTRYAQEARAYAIVTMLAAIASYLLLRALADDRWRWWAGYGAAAALGGLFNTFAVLLLVAHGITLLAARGGGAGAVTRRQLTRWLLAAVVAAAVVAPLFLAGYFQRVQIAWLTRPTTHDIVNLVEGFAGSSALVAPASLTALLGLLAGLVPRRRHPLTPAALALPWLVVPAGILITVSLTHPVFTPRYVLYSQPALALLCAAGMAWLAGLTAAALGRLTAAARRPGLARALARALAWLPAALIAVVMAVMLVPPQQDLRLPYSHTRVDDLRGLAHRLAAGERPGDAVFFLPINRRIIEAVYSGPYQRLRDVALDQSPLASATLAGTEVSPATLYHRFASVRRVWVIALSYYGHLPNPLSATDRAKLALLSRMHLAGRWWDGAIIVCLYTRT